MNLVITNVLLIVISGGIGYLVGQSRPEWFSLEGRQGVFLLGWIIALLLAGALRAAAVVYGPGAMIALLSIVAGFLFGVWIARRVAQTSR